MACVHAETAFADCQMKDKSKMFRMLDDIKYVKENNLARLGDIREMMKHLGVTSMGPVKVSNFFFHFF